MAREKLEVKRFEDYTKEEQMELMFHWWHYYGKLPLSFPEMEKFKELLDEDIEFVKNAALIAWARDSASQDLVRAMRGNFNEYRAQIMKLASSCEFKDIEELLESTFVEEVVRTYNNPEPDIPMSEEQILEGLAEIFGIDIKDATVINVSAEKVLNEEKPILTGENVQKMYRTCLLKDSEVVNDEPVVDFVLGEGVRSASVFSAERLEQNKGIITEMVEELPEIEMGISFLNMCVDKNGRQWADMHSTMDLLVQLGNATGAIRFLLPRDCWERFPGGMPYIIRDNEKDNKKVVGNKPKEYKKVLENFEMKYMG